MSDIDRNELAIVGRRFYFILSSEYFSFILLLFIFVACHLIWKYPLKGEVYVWSSYVRRKNCVDCPSVPVYVRP